MNIAVDGFRLVCTFGVYLKKDVEVPEDSL